MKIESIVAFVVLIECSHQILGQDAQVYLAKVHKAILKLDMFILEALLAEFMKFFSKHSNVFKSVVDKIVDIVQVL